MIKNKFKIKPDEKKKFRDCKIIYEFENKSDGVRTINVVIE